MNLPRQTIKRTLTVLACAAALVACADESGSEQAKPGAPQVGVYELEPQALAMTTRLPGRTSAYRVAEVRPQVSGIIEKRLFTEGAEVKKGQQLYQIDDSIYQAEYNKAKANLVTAERLSKRYQSLQKTSAISRQQYDDAFSNWKQAQAQADLARINLEYTKVFSPISGRIGRSAVTEGALVTSGQSQELATIQQLDPIYVDVTQPVKEVLRLQTDMAEGRLEKAADNQARVSLRLEDGSIYPMSGVLKFSEVTVDPGTSSVTMRAEFPNPDGRLLPGMFVQAQLNEGVRNGAILVPQQAVQRDQKGQASVWVVTAEDKAERRPVNTERTVGNQWLVNEGLQGGERVVTEGLQRLRPGVEVVATPATNVALINDFEAPDAGSAKAIGPSKAQVRPKHASQIAAKQ